jgi:putative transposase
MRGRAVTSSQQTAELPGRKEAMPEDGEVHPQVVPDVVLRVVLRVDRAFPAFFQRTRAGQTPGYRASMAATAPVASPLPSLRRGCGLTTVSWSCRRAGVLPCAGLAHLRGRRRRAEDRPKTVTICREADGGSVCCGCADVPVPPLLASGPESGIDLGREAFAPLSHGTRIFTPGWSRQAERALKTAHRRVSRRKAVTLLAKAHQRVRRQ